MQTDLKVTGRFDCAFVTGIRPVIETLAAKSQDITIDMSEAETVDPSGLGALAYLHKRLATRGYKIRVVGANWDLIRLFEDFHISSLFIE